MARPSTPSEPARALLRVNRMAGSLLAAAPVIAALLTPSACVIHRNASFATASALPSGARRPDGVAVDLQSAAPVASTSGKTSSGWMALAEPADSSGALAAVRTFFEAVAREDSATMRRALSQDAQWFMPSANPSGTAGGTPVEQAWERRFSKFDYRATGPEPVYRETEIEVYSFRDLDEVEGERPSRPAMMNAQDILVRVPIEIKRVGQERVFADEILFLVRRGSDGFKVRAVIEDFQAY